MLCIGIILGIRIFLQFDFPHGVTFIMFLLFFVLYGFHFFFYNTHIFRRTSITRNGIVRTLSIIGRCNVIIV